MTDCRNFENKQAASEWINSLGIYTNPSSVTPLKGSSAHEVAVGPVHAGVIEPGHFRFQCMGEDVYNLQIFLGYQHRGVEELIVKAQGNIARQIALAETCAGDTSVAAATAFAEIMECAMPQQFTAPNTQALRARQILIELERIANHVGDLGALAGDVAFLQTQAFCGRIRGEYLNMTALITGNRFGRNAIVPGGVKVSLTNEKIEQLQKWIKRTKSELIRALRLMFHAPSVCERFDGTGVVSRETARAIGLVGVARRASENFNGDVMARALVRRIEIEEAHEKIAALLAGKKPTNTPQAKFENNGEYFGIASTTPAWRGPLVHAAIFSATGNMLQYKIVDPSAYNWHGLAWALRNEQISNFPICNKSFNLSYCGTDR